MSCAIESALAQTYQNIEVIVLDDGSTDRSRDVIARFGDQVRAVFQENQGMTATGNKCFALARGEIIIYLDSDDLRYPSAVAQVVRAWTSGTAKVLLFHAFAFDMTGQNPVCAHATFLANGSSCAKNSAATLKTKITMRTISRRRFNAVPPSEATGQLLSRTLS